MPEHLENQPIIQMVRTIANKMRRSYRVYISKTEDREGDQWQVPDEEINLLDDIKDKWRALILVHKEGGRHSLLNL